MEENQALPDRRPPHAIPHLGRRRMAAARNGTGNRPLLGGGGKVGGNQTETARQPARRRVCRFNRQMVSQYGGGETKVHLHANADSTPA